MTDADAARESLWFIADQIQSWLDWDKRQRDKEGLATTPDTHIMSLPVPFWPNHGTLEHWIKTLHTASGYDQHPFRANSPPPFRPMTEADRLAFDGPFNDRTAPPLR